MEVIVAVLLCLLSALFFATVWLMRERKSYQRMFQAVLDDLDLAIGGTESAVCYDESMEDAIRVKLNQLVAISRMNCEGARKDKSLVQALISDIAHQVRTPLTNIMLYAGLVKEQAAEEETQRMTSQIQSQAEKLDFFMRELVRSSYLETEMISVHRKQEEIDRLIAESVQAVELAALKKKIMFQIPECGKSGVFDLRWTREALVNVLDNAVKYSPVQSTVTVSVSFYENFFCIQVADEGIGIDEEEQGAVFQRFYRAKGAKREPGLGIGLYLVREIIEKQNGYVKVTSAPGEGAVFSLYLPCNM